jgi:hypothetical protein
MFGVSEPSPRACALDSALFSNGFCSRLSPSSGNA